ncbi:hypothetical protein ElyMa_000736000 [Elysia marginata]|uniref:Uncharacterized protein n=1 Tax=Elysia marginata TaxID=1093978 RepID=A0AAV4GMN2_9GAST|nr:hypothetical protein ElyMa_000736000 [Elysia marginata]
MIEKLETRFISGSYLEGMKVMMTVNAGPVERYTGAGLFANMSGMRSPPYGADSAVGHAPRSRRADVYLQCLLAGESAAS